MALRRIVANVVSSYLFLFSIIKEAISRPLNLIILRILK
jgi:hypothetical protein